MRPDHGLKSMFDEVVTLRHLTAESGAGEPTFGAAVQISARIEVDLPKETNAPGQEQVAYSKVFLWPVTTTGASYSIGPRDQLTLPAAYTPGEVDVVTVSPRANHYLALVLARDAALRRQATVQRPSQQQEPKSGQMVTAWVDILTDAWAIVRPIGGTEVQPEDQRRAHRLSTFRFDFFTDPQTSKIPTPAYRIVSQGRFFEVLDVRELGQREAVQFLTRERAA